MLRFALIATLALSTTAANAADQLPTARVAYHDLNLATPQGAAAFHPRIKKAARTVCAPWRNMFGTLSAQSMALAGRCETETLSYVRPQEEAAIANAATTRLADRDARIEIAGR